MGNSSFAIWSNNVNIDIDLHINCWIIEEGKDIIDFGLMISHAELNDIVSFYIPFAFEEQKIHPLTTKIQDNESLRAMIFNEKLSTSQSNNDSPNCKFYTREDGKEFSFCLNDYKYQKDYEGGVKLTFVIDGNPNGHDTYFRFRLDDVSEKSIFARKNRQVSALTGVREEHVNVEININQFRKLSNSLQTSIFKSGDILNRVNMFLMSNIDLSPVFSTHDEKPKTRILENADKWGNYIKLDETKRYLAYQYKKVTVSEVKLKDKIIKTRQPFKSFTIFSKFEITLSTEGFKIKAILTLLFIGALSSLIVSTLLSIGETQEIKEIKDLVKLVESEKEHLLLIKPQLDKLQTDVNTSLRQIQVLSNDIERLQITSIDSDKTKMKRVDTKSEKHLK